jgi:hypothetical protein
MAGDDRVERRRVAHRGACDASGQVRARLGVLEEVANALEGEPNVARARSGAERLRGARREAEAALRDVQELVDRAVDASAMRGG